MADVLTVSVLCPYCATLVSVVPPDGCAALQHLIVRCQGNAEDGCAQYFVVRLECEIRYWAQTSPLAFADEQELGSHNEGYRD